MRVDRPDDGVTARLLAGSGRIGRALAADANTLGGLRPVVGPLPALIVDVSGPDDILGAAAAGLGDGPATAEAIVVRLRRAGRDVALTAATPPVTSVRLAVRTFRRYGRDAVRTWRADPGLLSELRLGSWWIGGWRTRLLRRAALALRIPPALLGPRWAADVAFWQGVRSAATPTQWRRLTSSYVVLCYHRVTGSAAPGQERMDVPPAALRRQLRLLQILRWRPLRPDDLVTFHGPDGPGLPRRRYVVTADDGFDDAVRALEHHPGVQLFVVTSAVGGRAEWLGGAPLAGWHALRAAATRGAAVGSHARRHVRLDELDGASVDAELRGSLADLAAQLGKPPIPLLAYPYGAHSLAVRDAARRAGYSLAFTTRQGRNGAGTDAWSLRRVEPKIWDSTASFLWKAWTGESPPPQWERRLEQRWRRRR